MKKLLALGIGILSLCLGLTNSWAALGATCKWEVRTTGATTNGGFYTAGGTDYSQQDAAQYALTGATTAAANAIILHASAAANMVGNGLYVVSGTNFIVGWYEVISVVAGVSITVDRNCTTNAGALGVVNVGGAIDHPNTISTVVVAGNTVYIQNGTYVKVGANAYVFTATIPGTSGNPVRWIGYITNHTTITTGTDRPLISGGNNTTNCLLVDALADINSFENLVFYDATADGVLGSSGATGCIFKNCRAYSNANEGFDIDADGGLFNCETDTNTGEGINDSGAGRGVMVGIYAHDNSDNGIGCDAVTAHLVWFSCISESNVGDGLSSSGANSEIFASNNLAYNNSGASSDGFVIDNANGPLDDLILLNNSAVDNGRYGFNSEQAVGAYNIGLFDYNNYNGNGTAGLLNITAGLNDNTNDPAFTDAPNGNFTITSADTALKGKGFPQIIQGATGDYQWNIGVDQDTNSASGGGASFFSMN